ncbi:MAG: hypothetical protein E3J88_00415 [Anaerolineales bacterium]|nr:MAG: hypothetical protein E3J88_00415 [Anaerolineales bacterium]
MNLFSGTVSKIELGEDRGLRAVISCPTQFIPEPGQYLQAHSISDRDAVTAFSLFPGDQPGEDHGDPMSSFTAAPPIPLHWQPGDTLTLRGPLGQGFSIPENTKHVGLVALGDTVSRLLPLSSPIINAGGEVALFSDTPLPRLPTQVEANPLKALADALTWADFLAFDGPLETFKDVRNFLGLSYQDPLPCPAQALVYTPMPCGGMADCGVCAVKWKGKKYKLACKDGPVFQWDLVGG